MTEPLDSLITEDSADLKLKEGNEIPVKSKLDDLYEDFEIVRGWQTKKKCECIVAFSGGAKSCSLMHTLIHEHGLQPTAIMIDTGPFRQHTSRDHMTNLLEHWNYPLYCIYYTFARSTFRKLYRYFIQNPSRSASELYYYYSLLIRSILVQFCFVRGVSIIYLGDTYSPTSRYFYQIPEKVIKTRWYPELFKEKPFTEYDRSHLINPEEYKNLRMPKIVFPYHILPNSEPMRDFNGFPLSKMREYEYYRACIAWYSFNISKALIKSSRVKYY